MGLLKHVLLPTFSLFHAFVAKVCLVDEGLVKMAAPGLAKKRDIKEEPPTAMEQHLTRAVGGMSLVFVVNNIVAILQENAHYRGMALLLETIYFAVDSYSYAKGKRKDATPVYAMLGLSILGLGVHAMEPGIFTTDKNLK